MSVFVFMVFFSLIRGNSIFHYESSYRLINLFISSLLAFSAYSLLSLIINIVLNKIYCIFFGIIFSSIIFVFNINTLVGIFMQGFCAGILGIIVGVLVLKILKSAELDEAWNTLHKKFWKTKTVVPDMKEL